MFKRMLLILTLVCPLMGQITSKEKDFPSVIDKTWMIAGSNTNKGVVMYVNLADITVDTTLQATAVWVKVFDFPAKKILIQKMVYRNNGQEYAVIGTAVYTDKMDFLSSSTVPYSEISWSLVIPESLAAGVKATVLNYLNYLKTQQTQPTKGSV